MIRSTYEQMFVHFYRWSTWVDGPSGAYNVFFAALSLSLALLLNIFSVAMLLDLALHFGWMQAIAKLPKSVLAVAAAAFYALNYLYFRQGNRYKALIARYPVRSAPSRFAMHKIVIVYMVSSLAVVIALMFALLVFRDRWTQ